MTYKVAAHAPVVKKTITGYAYACTCGYGRHFNTKAEAERGALRHKAYELEYDLD